MKLFAWQERAAQSAESKSGWGLFAAPGTGKTLAALNIARREGLEPVVIAPKAVKPQWQQEGVQQCFHYEQLLNKQRLKDVLVELQRGRRCLIVDEGHRIANPTTKTTRAILALARHAHKRLDLTGTPTANSPADLYCQMKFLQPDAEIEPRRTFMERYMVPNVGLASRIRGNPFIPMRNPDGTIRLRNMGELLERLKGYGTFLNDDEVEQLPERTFVVRECEPSKELKKAHKELLSQYTTQVNGVELSAENAAVLATRLLRLASGLGEKNENELLFPNPKINQVLGDLEQFANEGKVILWSVWTAERELLRLKLDTLGVRHTSDPEAFKTQPELKVLVGSPKQHGTGLNLQCARYQLWLSRTWSLVEREQGLRRNFRVGQTEKTHVVDYVTSSTIDARALNALENKTDLLNLIIKGKL